ncbi:matrixin family metalloprotease [Bradyrhizobium barranii subsp. apii]|uniref:Matrixin family metalloprotease n=1 Tax=Bradyrhizobium barranii subsp. apii TaxID=2819348 RepID=A0A8T5V8A6_9BRAD|nr:matrixin family metalloprotease [Bradyrhizobium barranii]UPT91420.1 matrixin family metalloprotease [Bradyrhizobium barranii subsp. apii]
MLRQIRSFSGSTKASPNVARALRLVAANAAALALLASSALAGDNYKLLDWNWKFQKYPMASSFEYCSINAPRDPTDAAKPWSKVLDTIRTAADKWRYSKKDAKKESTIFQFRFTSEDCPQCPGLNYIEFGTLNDPKKPAETSYPNVSGTAKMKKCAVRFNSAMSWHVTNDEPKPTEYDLLSVALHEFGHCVGLDDLPDGFAVMSVGLKPGEKRRDLQSGDIAGRNKIYGDP